MYDMVVVGGFDTHAHLNGDADCLLIGQPGLPLNIFFQRDAFHQFHDDIVNVVFRPNIVYIDDVGVHEAGSRLGLDPKL